VSSSHLSVASVREAFEQGLRLHQAADLAGAEAAYRMVLAQDDQHADAWHLLGVLASQCAQPAPALALIQHAIALQPAQADYYVNLANAQQALGLSEEASHSLLKALSLNPQLAMAHNNLGLLRQGQRQFAAAEHHLRMATELGFTAAWSNLGSLLALHGRLTEALTCYESALRYAPDSLEARYNLANAQVQAGQPQEAIASYEEVLARAPSHADSWNNMGIQLGKLGRIRDACVALRTAMSLAPQNAAYHSNLIFFLDYDFAIDAAAQQRERHRWWQQHIEPLRLPTPTFENSRDPVRKLRVGYVSADFWRHSAAFTFAPMLQHYNRSEFSVFCYANQQRADDLTAELQRSVDGWRDIAELDDAAAASLIRSDQIDILVDLSAHSAGHRLGVFARRPAPVQISAWGHANGTGLPEIDYLLSDAVTLPPALAPLYAETLTYLPCTLTYSPGLDLPAVSPLPALTSPLTFGCFNRLAKVDATVLAVWSQLLTAIPDARLLFKSPELSDSAAQDALLASAAAAGITEERILMQGKTSQLEHLAAYGQVDICLDPFPHGGGISTFEALWMGVPVLTLLGDTQVGRLSAGIVSAVGLTDWVAVSKADYIDRGVHLASNLPTLAAVRSQLRTVVATSVAGNPQRYADEVYKIYRQLWQKWTRI